MGAKQTRKLPALESRLQSYFIQTSAAITVSLPTGAGEYVISSIFLKADSLTIAEEPPLFWQPSPAYVQHRCSAPPVLSPFLFCS